MTSCITERKCNQRYPPKVIVKDSIVVKNVEVVVYDTIYIKADTIITSDTVYKDVVTGLLTSNKVYSETEYAKAWAQVIDSKLFLNLIQNDTMIANKIKANIQIKEVYRDRVTYVNKWITHWYDSTARVLAIIFILAIVIKIVIGVVKTYIKPF